MKRRVHILGAGGIGVALAWVLARIGWDITVVESNSHKVEWGRKEGLTVQQKGTQRAEFVQFDDWTPPAEGLVLLCTKTYDNPAILARLSDSGRLVPVQNGYDPQLDARGHPGEGIASFVSESERDRPVIRITRPGKLHIGPRRQITEAERENLSSLAEGLAQGGLFKVEWVENVLPYKAAKLMYNAAISPLAGAAGIDNGELLSDPLARRLFFGLLQENYAILHHAKVPLARIGPFHPDTVSRILRTPLLPSVMAAFFRPSLRGTYCSMAPDMLTGNTEIEAYNGHMIRLANGFPAPLNKAAFSMIKEMMNRRLTPQRENLRQLESALAEPVSW